MQGFEKVLIIGKVWPEPKSSAAGTRMMQLIDFFQSQNSQIVFASTANESPYQEDLSLLNIETVSIQLNSDAFDEFLKQINPTAVLFDRFMTEEQFGWRVMENCPGAIRILDSEDLHGLRFARHESIKKDGTLDHVELFNEKSIREVASIYRSDLTLLVSEIELELLQTKFGVPKQKLKYLPIFKSESQRDLPSFEERDGFLFIGNFWHEPNWDAVRYLRTTIWPLIRQKMPNAVINVYGAYASQKVTDLDSEKEGFLIHGRAEDAEEVTMKARVSLVPLRFGAGIKGKILEAMHVGTPVLTTSIGAESMTVEGQLNGAIADDPQAFSDEAVKLYTSKSMWEHAQKVGFEMISTKYDADNYLPDFRTELIELAKNIEQHRRLDFTSILLQHQSLLSTKYLSKWIEEKNK